ncbi:MAG: MarR family transcriptional regulator [Vicingaceae bacterium]|jgi:DNA-binding MarR family transcriptional regulator
MGQDNKVDQHIKATWHNMFKMYNQMAAEYGSTQATGLILLNIEKEGTPSTSIAPNLGMEATSMSRIMKTIEDNGLIYREQDKVDRRMVRIFLTEAGLEKRKLAKKAVAGFNDQILAEVDRDKLDTFFEVMVSVNKVINKYREQNGI